MLVRRLILLLSFYTCGKATGKTIKTWILDSSFTNHLNWNLGRLPCERDTIVLSSYLDTVLDLSSAVKGRGIVLPVDGELELQHGSEIQLSDKPSPSCQGADNLFSGGRSGSWLDWQNWKEKDIKSSAKPHQERVPCIYDQVSFPSISFSVKFPQKKVAVNQLSIGDDLLTEQKTVDDYLDSITGQRQFVRETAEEGIKLINSCTDELSCECGTTNFLKEICGYHPCETPFCLDPITPRGFCCPICGAFLLFEPSLNEMRTLKKSLESILKDYEEYLDWHMSRVEPGLSQLVLRDKDGFSSGKDAANKVYKFFKANNHLVHSTHPIHATSLAFNPDGVSWITILLETLAASFGVLMAIYYYFYRPPIDLDWVKLRDTLLRNGSSRFVFARFENTAGEVELTEEAAEEDVEQEDGDEDLRAFDNPMYTDPSYTGSPVVKFSSYMDRAGITENESRLSKASNEEKTDETMSSLKEI